MQDIYIQENGLYLYFAVDDENRLRQGYVSTTRRPVPEKFSRACTAVEVQTVGNCDRARYGAVHNNHSCPEVPTYVAHTHEQNEKGRLLCFHLQSSQLDIWQYYQFYNGIQTLSAWCRVQNRAEGPVGLEYVASLTVQNLGTDDRLADAEDLILYTPHNAWCEELHWTRQTLREAGYNPMRMPYSMKRVEATNTGAWSTKEHLPMGAIYNTRRDETLLWQIEHNGSWHWEVSSTNYSTFLTLSGPTEAENGWYKALAPGEQFTSVPVALSVAKGDFESAVQELTKYRRVIVDPRHLDPALPIIFNDYMQCIKAQPDTEKEIAAIDRAAELGAEIYCMDAGWYSMGDWWPLVGEWNICNERFSGGGLKPLFDRILSHGMRAGIWIEPEVMGVECPMVDQFKDCFFMRHGQPVNNRGRYQFDFRKQKVIDHMNNTIDRLIRDLGVSYFKFDYNIEPGVGTETDADSFGDGLMQHNKAFLDWVDSLYDRYPGIIIENCSSGGMRTEYGSLKHFSIQSVSDASFYYEFSHMSVMGPTGMLPEQCGIWVCPLKRQTPAQDAYAAINAILHRFYPSGEIPWLEPQRFAVVKQAVEVYKQIRPDIPGSLPIFPEGICTYNHDWHVGGRISGNGKRLYLTIGHLRGEGDCKTIHLPKFAGKMSSARILYPDFVGQITLKDAAVEVQLPQDAAILVKIDLK